MTAEIEHDNAHRYPNIGRLRLCGFDQGFGLVGRE
jgi:hypothetical protein